MKKKSSAGNRKPAVVLDHFLEMQEAIRHAESANWQAAENICRRIVANNPQHIDALNMLGVVAIKRGQWAQAVQMMQKVIHLKSDYLNAYINLGMVMREMGDLEGAARYSRQALKINPQCAPAFSNLGNALLGMGKPGEAVEAYEAALKIDPNYWDALNNLNVARRSVAMVMPSQPQPANIAGPSRAPTNLSDSLQRLREQLSSQAKQAVPPAKNPEIQAPPTQTSDDELLQLADQLLSREEYENAEQVLRKLVQLQPDNAAAHCNLASALMHLDRHAEALPHCRRAVELAPLMPEAHNNLGLALCAADEPEQAMESYARALELRPGFLQALENKAIALRECGQFAEAGQLLERVLAIEPDHASAHYERGLMLLHLGRFAEGFREYEWRRQIKKHGLAPVPQPEWDGRPFPGQRLLIHAEQGMGDAIQFVRYLPQVKQRGGTVILRCHQPLLKLFETVAGVDELVGTDQTMPQADWHLSLLSLGKLFTCDESSIPTMVPYLRADAEKVSAWSRRVQALPGIKVGLVWSGNPAYKNDRNRSLELDLLAPLAAVPGVSFVSLQKGPAASQLAPAGLNLTDWTAELEDFADTAALIACLDLIISVDTAVAHLAGALGRPAWTLLPFLADWRWLSERTDSPWYPGMRLYRQSRRGEWSPVIAKVAEQLALLAKEHDSTAERPAGAAVSRSWQQHVADFIPSGATAVQIGELAGDLDSCLPPHCTLVRMSRQAFAEGEQIHAGTTHLIVLEVPGETGITEAELARLRNTGRRLILGVPAERAAELQNLLPQAGFAVLADEEAEGMRFWLLSPFPRPEAPRRRIILITTGQQAGFGDLLRRRLVFSILPPGAELTIATVNELDGLQDGFDLAIVGTGGDLDDKQISESLLAFLDRMPRAVGLFGLSSRIGDTGRVARLLDRLFLWGARFEQDVLLYGRGRNNALHFGDWLIDAFPAMAEPSEEEIELPPGSECVTPEAVFHQLQAHRRAVVPHPDLLLGALCTCGQVAYRRSETDDLQRYRALLQDVFGRHFPEAELFTVERQAVLAYKARIRLMVDELRKALAIALRIAPP